VAEFEGEFAAYTRSTFAIGVNSGTSALHLALLAANVGPGDEVITTPFTFVATVAAIHYTGAKAVFVDIDPRTYTIDPARIEEAITPKTKAIIPVHLYGHPADMDPITAIAKKHELIVVEDACQAHGAEYKGRRVGSIGAFGCFSFYPGKNLGACGEGGLVTTQKAEFNRIVRMLRDWGAETKYEHLLKGYNYRLEAIQAAVLRVKLRYLEGWTEARRAAAARYDECFAGSGIITPEVMKYARHVYHIYAIRTDVRATCQEALHVRGIRTGIHYPTPVHLLPAYADLGYQAGQFPHSERAANEVLSLPMFAELTSDQAETVARAMLELASQPLPRKARAAM
jgi:dTDP-4-amino-4,6-dideoxygalactose transaminase